MFSCAVISLKYMHVAHTRSFYSKQIDGSCSEGEKNHSFRENTAGSC